MFFIPTWNKVTTLTLILLSILLAVYGPVSVTNAQAAVDTQKFKDLKQKANKEIDRRLDNYKKTSERLDVSITFANKEYGHQGKLGLPSKLKEKVVGYTDKVIEKLVELKDKVNETTSLEELESVVDDADAQFHLTHMMDVQAAVTSAIESLTSVVDKIQTTFDGMRSQVTKMKECLSNVNNDAIETDDFYEPSNVSGPACDDFNLSSKEVIASAESQMANVSTMSSTIKSVLSSSIILLTGLVATFSSLLGELGNLDDLGNLGRLLGGGGDSSSALSSVGSLSGLMGSFGAIASQLGIANGMAGNTQGMLSNLTSYISI